MILATPIAERPPIKGPFTFVILLADANRWNKDGTRKVIDADNFLKAPLDLLKGHGLIQDDHLSEYVTAAWSVQAERGQCVVRVWWVSDERPGDYVS